MGIYKYINKTWRKPKINLGYVWQTRLINWRKEPAVIKIEKPTRIDKARMLGYKAKNGVVVARVRVPRGGRMRMQIRAGRKSKKFRHRKIVGKSYQWVAEERANKFFRNLEVLNSYWVTEDALHYWYEVILIDPDKPEIQKDPKYKGILTQRGRVFRGLTSAGTKSRGLGGKGIGYEKNRPSLRAHNRQGKN
ncbi:MAG: 50S ribosomal protein L15e [Candidatus Nanoarchaeia archaeon]